MLQKKIKILIIDDNQDDIELYKRLLSKSFECMFVEANLAHVALNFIRNKKFDIIYLDYLLPDMDGIEFIKHVKKEKFYYCPVIVLTGHGDEEIATSFLKMGASDYIGKSKISVDSLRRITNNAIDHFHYKQLVKEKNQISYNFADIVAHDLKSPISRILAYSKLLNRNTQQQKMNVQISNILQDAEYCLVFINTLYQYAKIGRSSIEYTKVKLNDVVDQAVNNLELDIKRKSAEINVGDLPAVEGNRIWLIQLFQNIIGNSLKFSKDKIVISINSLNIKGNYTKIDITDNGIGFDESKVDQIFAPFYKLHHNNEYDGLGLGLALCKIIVDQHNGKIDISSKVGSGTKISIILSLFKE